MRRVRVLTSRREESAIFVGADILGEAARELEEAGVAPPAVLVADRAVPRESYEGAWRSAREFLAVEGGERVKSLSFVEELLGLLLARDVKRTEGVVAVGGGSVLDAVGFACAVYKRGVPVVYVATTLLAMVDAAIGGKTAVNFRGLKNAVGVTRQPAAVVCDTAFLSSLPERELWSGAGEVVKTALLAGGELLELVGAAGADARAYARDEVVHACAAYKAAIVGRDPDERAGLRDVLNFGHTAGHVFESVAAGHLPHGVCVAHGMVVEQRLARAAGLCGEDALVLVEELTEPVRTRYRMVASGRRADRHLLAGDKKARRAGFVRFVYLEEPGRPAITDVDEERFLAALRRYELDERS